MYIFTLIQDNTSALHAASSNGHDEVVRVLLAAKATVNTQSKVSYSTVEPRLSEHLCPRAHSGK